MEALEHVEEVRVLRLQPGDTIVARIAGRVSEAVLNEIGRALRERFPDHAVLMHQDGVDISVVRSDA